MKINNKISQIKNKVLNLDKKRKIILIISILLILIAIAIFLIANLNPEQKIIRSIKNKDYEKAKNIYSKEINGDRKKELEVEENIDRIISETVEKFNKGNVNYEEAKSTLETIKNTGIEQTKAEEALKDIESLHNSKISYTKALEYYKKNDFYNALLEFSKVIEKDNNYEEAKQKNTSILEQYKTEIFTEIEQKSNENDYTSVLNLLENLKKVIPNDTEVQAKIEIANNKIMESLKSSQEVSVETASIYTAWYSSSIDGITVIVKNNTNKVVKNFSVTMLAFDKNGYPLQISYNDTKSYGKGDLANIQPGQTYGKDNYYYTYYNEDKISKVIACVESVEYYDGTTWENPYYSYWLGKYDNKQYTE